MSLEVHRAETVHSGELHGGDGHHGGHAPHVAHQFEDIEQQNESYIVGMWTFLVTEIMFFGALFLALSLYRAAYAEDFHIAHTALDIKLGMTNTLVLLTSSVFMALAVRGAQLGDRVKTQFWIGLTILCAFAFLGIKAIEYTAEFKDHHFPGPTFNADELVKKAEEEDKRTGHTGIHSTSPIAAGVSPPALTATGNGYDPQHLTVDPKQLFFSLYFIMTGLHGIHVIIGIVLLGTLFFMVKFRHPAVEYFMPVELAGLYWHFVDIVWIFLFPLIYLIGR
jgi:cytochrome c oxidase subunit III